MNAAACMDPPQYAVDQSGDTKLWSDESFYGDNLADIHSDDTRSIAQGCHEVHRVVPPQSTGLGSTERWNQRGIKSVTVECQVDGPTTGLHHIGNPAGG